MKKFVSVLLFFILLFNFGGSYFVFKLVQYAINLEIELEISGGIDKKDLSIIIIPLNEESVIFWTKPNKEFKYKGDMYDLVKTEIKNQKIYYYCINDKKEKELIANFNKSHDSKKNTDKIVKQYFFNTYIVPKGISKHTLASSKFEFTTSIFHYNHNITKVLIPPPKFI